MLGPKRTLAVKFIVLGAFAMLDVLIFLGVYSDYVAQLQLEQAQALVDRDLGHTIAEYLKESA